MSYPLVKLANVAPSKPLKTESPSESEIVWQVALDHIESNTGILLKRELQPFSKAGISTHWFDERYVLYSKLRPYLNKVLLPDQKGLGTTELVPMLPDEKRLERKYLAYYLKSPQFVEWISNQTAGAKMPRVAMNVFWEHEIPLPPLAEQKRIAAILDKADAIRRKRQQAIQLADDFLRSVFLDMFGDPVTNPKGWEVASFVELFAKKPQIGTINPVSNTGYVHVIRVGEIGKKEIAYNKVAVTEFNSSDVNKYKLETGDLLLARAIGSEDHLGKASLFWSQSDIYIYDSHVMRLRFNKAKVNYHFIFHWLNSKGGRSNFLRQSGRTAVQFNINSEQVGKISIPLPPLNLQRIFSSHVEKIEFASKKMTLSLLEAEAQFNSLSQKAFSGQL